MKSNKVAMIVAAFALPEDFQGGPLDALKLMVEYHETKGKNNKRGVQIGNNHGHINGWTKRVYGKVIEIL